MRRNPIDFGSRGQRSRSTFALCVKDLVGRIQTTVLVQSLSNFICKWMMRVGTLSIFGHRVIGQGQLWHSMYETLWTQYRLQFGSNLFQISHVHVSCSLWEEEPYWFWVTGSKVKGNFGHNTDHSLSPITFKLHMLVVGDERKNPVDLPTCEGMLRFALYNLYFFPWANIGASCNEFEWLSFCVFRGLLSSVIFASNSTFGYLDTKRWCAYVLCPKVQHISYQQRSNVNKCQHLQ